MNHSIFLPGAPLYRAVVLDDDQGSASLVVKLLAEFRCSAIACATPAQTIELVLKGDIDIVALDISMPSLDGYQLLSLIRSHELTSRVPSVPVVAVTGRTSIIDRANVISHGFAAHVGKPVSLECLEGALGRALLLRSELERTRYTTDRANIEDRVHRLFERSGSSRFQSAAGVAMVVEQQGGIALYQAVIAALGCSPSGVRIALESFIDLAQSIGAKRLGERCSDLIAHAGSDDWTFETAAVLARAELDRVVFTLRENLLAHVPVSTHQGPDD